MCHNVSKAELVKLRYFAGLTIEQAARILDISPATAKRHWAYAKAWDNWDTLGMLQQLGVVPPLGQGGR